MIQYIATGDKTGVLFYEGFDSLEKACQRCVDELGNNTIIMLESPEMPTECVGFYSKGVWSTPRDFFAEVYRVIDVVEKIRYYSEGYGTNQPFNKETYEWATNLLDTFERCEPVEVVVADMHHNQLMSYTAHKPTWIAIDTWIEDYFFADNSMRTLRVVKNSLDHNEPYALYRTAKQSCLVDCEGEPRLYSFEHHTNF